MVVATSIQMSNDNIKYNVKDKETLRTKTHFMGNFTYNVIKR